MFDHGRSSLALTEKCYTIEFVDTRNASHGMDRADRRLFCLVYSSFRCNRLVYGSPEYRSLATKLGSTNLLRDAFSSRRRNTSHRGGRRSKLASSHFFFRNHGRWGHLPNFAAKRVQTARFLNSRTRNQMRPRMLVVNR